MSLWDDLGNTIGNLFTGKEDAAGTSAGRFFSDLDPFKQGNILGSKKITLGAPAPVPVAPDYTDQVIKALQQGEHWRLNQGLTRQASMGAGPPQAELSVTREGLFGNMPKLGGTS